MRCARAMLVGLLALMGLISGMAVPASAGTPSGPTITRLLPDKTTCASNSTEPCSIDIGWSGVSGADSYVIELSWDGGAHWVEAPAPRPTAPGEYVNVGPGTLVFRIRAIDSTGAIGAPGPVSSSVTVGGKDTIPPLIESVSVLTPTVYSGASPATVWVDMVVDDNHATFSIDGKFRAPSYGTSGYTTLRVSDVPYLVSGTVMHGTWRMAFTVPAHSEVGRWPLGEVSATDTVNLNRWYGLTAGFTPIPGYAATTAPSILVSDVDLSAIAAPVISGMVKARRTVRAITHLPAGVAVHYLWSLRHQVTRKVRVKRHGRWVRVKKKVSVLSSVGTQSTLRLKKSWKKGRVSVTATFSDRVGVSLAKASPSKKIR